MAFCSHCGKELSSGASFCYSCGAPVSSAGTVAASPSPPPTPSPPQTTYPAYPQATMYPPPAYPTATSMNYAGVVERAVAVIIDSIIVFFISLIILIPVGLFSLIAGYNFFFSPAILLFFFLGILYFTYFESTSGQTPGKQLLGIRVVDENSRRPVDFGRALVRNILRIIDELPFLYLLGFIIVEVDQRKRRLGDMAASTIVVRA